MDEIKLGDPYVSAGNVCIPITGLEDCVELVLTQAEAERLSGGLVMANARVRSEITREKARKNIDKISRKLGRKT